MKISAEFKDAKKMNNIAKWLLIGVILLGIILTAFGLIRLTIAMHGIHSKSIEYVTGMVSGMVKQGMNVEEANNLLTGSLLKYDKINAIKVIIIGVALLVTTIILRVFFFNDRN